MNLPQAIDPKKSLFDVCMQEIETSKKLQKSDLKGLMACFLMIYDYREQLFDTDVDFAIGLTEDYISNQLRVDFNKIIQYLNDYEGDAIGVQEAKEEMDQANVKLYGIRGTFKEKSSESYSVRLETRAEGWRQCREFVQAAYSHLEYLKDENPDLSLLLRKEKQDQTT